MSKLKAQRPESKKVLEINYVSACEGKSVASIACWKLLEKVQSGKNPKTQARKSRGTNEPKQQNTSDALAYLIFPGFQLFYFGAVTLYVCRQACAIHVSSAMSRMLAIPDHFIFRMLLTKSNRKAGENRPTQKISENMPHALDKHHIWAGSMRFCSSCRCRMKLPVRAEEDSKSLTYMDVCVDMFTMLCVYIYIYIQK